MGREAEETGEDWELEERTPEERTPEEMAAEDEDVSAEFSLEDVPMSAPTEDA